MNCCIYIQLRVTLNAQCLTVQSATTMSVRMLLRPTSASLNIQRKAGGNATASVPPGSIRTESDLFEVTLPTILYRLIFKGYYSRMHELQVQYAQQFGLITCWDIDLMLLMVILIFDTVWRCRQWFN